MKHILNEAFNVVMDPPPVAAFLPNYAKSSEHIKANIFGALLVASGLLNLYIKLNKEWLSYDPITIFGHTHQI